MDINQTGVVLMGVVLGWFLMFAVRRYKVQWGAFASFMAAEAKRWGTRSRPRGFAGIRKEGSSARERSYLERSRLGSNHDP